MRFGIDRRMSQEQKVIGAYACRLAVMLAVTAAVLGVIWILSVVSAHDPHSCAEPIRNAYGELVCVSYRLH